MLPSHPPPQSKTLVSPNKSLLSDLARTQTRGASRSFLDTLPSGFSFLSEVTFPRGHRTRRVKTMTSTSDQANKSLQQQLSERKQRLNFVRRNVCLARELEFSEYINRSLKYQQLLNLNQQKKRLPTLNSKVGQIIKKPVEVILKNEYYELSVCSEVCEGWKPQSREGHTAVVHCGHAVIIGGHCSVPYASMYVYSLESHEWIREVKLLAPLSYHTSLLYKNRFIIVFGGMGAYDLSQKGRSCSNSVQLVDLSNWSVKAVKIVAEQTVEPRRSHSASLVSKNMIIFGGLNAKKECLKDLHFLDLKELKWTERKYSCETRQLTDFLGEGLARHQSVSIFKSKKFKQVGVDLLDYEGVYMFCGHNGAGEANIVIQLQFIKGELVFREVDYTGIPPPSANATTHLYNETSVVVVSGEHNQREIRLFKAKERQFWKIKYEQHIDVLRGVGSPLCRSNDTYYLFFGLDERGYLGQTRAFMLSEKFLQQNGKKKRSKEPSFNWREIDASESDSSISMVQ